MDLARRACAEANIWTEGETTRRHRSRTPLTRRTSNAITYGGGAPSTMPDETVVHLRPPSAIGARPRWVVNGREMQESHELVLGARRTVTVFDTISHISTDTLLTFKEEVEQELQRRGAI